MNVQAVVAIAHDRGSRAGRYSRFAELLVGRGIAACAVDFARGPFDGVIREIGTMATLVRNREPAAPLFLLGHGTGAVAACLHALQHPEGLAGIICESAALDLPARAGLIRMLGRLVPSPGWLPGLALLRANDRLRGLLGGLTLPLLILHGANDTRAPPSGSEYLHGHAGSCDKTLQLFEGYHHDLIGDRGYDLVREKACRWIETQLAAGECRRRIGIEYINEQP